MRGQARRDRGIQILQAGAASGGRTLLGHSSTAVTSRYLDHLTNAQAVTVLEGVNLPGLGD